MWWWTLAFCWWGPQITKWYPAMSKQKVLMCTLVDCSQVKCSPLFAWSNRYVSIWCLPPFFMWLLTWKSSHRFGLWVGQTIPIWRCHLGFADAVMASSWFYLTLYKLKWWIEPRQYGVDLRNLASSQPWNFPVGGIPETILFAAHTHYAVQAVSSPAATVPHLSLWHCIGSQAAQAWAVPDEWFSRFKGEQCWSGAAAELWKWNVGCTGCLQRLFRT